jgi:hypothetical protein
MAITRLGPNNSTNISGINLTSQVTGTLPTGNGGTGATSFSPGKVLQVVSASTTSSVATTSTSFVDINLSLNITPSATSSKIFVTYTGSNETNGTGGNKLSLQILRDSTQIADATGIGSLGSENGIVISNALSVLDEPSTTSQITYKMQGKSDDGTVMVFNINGDKTTITAFEIAG